MDNSINYDIRFNVNGAQVDAVVGRLENGVPRVDAAVGRMGNNFGNQLRRIQAGINTIKLESILNQVNRFADGLNDLSKPGLDLSTNMYDLQAITGVAGDKLKEIEGYARDAAKEFGGSAADNVEGYKLVLSQLSPEIAKVPLALKGMGNSIAVTSKLMAGDSVAATEVLTTAMNQYQISTDDPIQASKEMASMMNVMAAAAKEGSAELPQIKTALEQSGMAAKAANVSFAETNAAIQILDKAGKKGSEGGVAIRNVLATLSEGRFLPKEVKKELSGLGIDIEQLGNKNLTLSQRLKLLNPIMNDSALVTKLFGKENSNAALALMSGIPEMERLTTAITGTKTAYEQAAIIMESPAEKSKRLQASVDDLKISLFNGTNGWLGYAAVVGSATKDITNMWPVVGILSKVLGINTIVTALSAASTDIAAGATTRWAVVQAAFNTTLWANPITWVVAAVVALIAVIGYVIYKTDGWGKMWDHTVKAAKYLWEAFTSTAKWEFNTLIDGIMIGLNTIKGGWYEFKNATGLGDEGENNAAISAINSDTERRKKEIIDGAQNTIDLYKKSADEFKAAAGSLTWNNKTIGGMKKDLMGDAGISGNSTPGASGGSAVKSLATSGKKSNEAIATGGTKNTTVNIHIGKQIETFTINAASVKEGTQRMREIVVDELTRAVAMGAALGS